MKKETRSCQKTVKYEENCDITVGALSTVTKSFVKGLEDLEIIGRVETI